MASSATMTNSHSFHSTAVHRNGTPSRYPKNNGGSPSGNRHPPQLQTMKMKKTTVCWTCFRSRLVSRSGRTSNIAAPVVPIRLASNPAGRKKGGVGQRMGGQVAFDADAAADRVQTEQQDDERQVLAQTALASTAPVWAKFGPAAAGKATHGTGQWTASGCVQQQVVDQRDRRQSAGHIEPVQIVFPPVCRGAEQRQHGNRPQQQDERRRHPVGRMSAYQCRLTRRRQRSTLFHAGASKMPPSPR